MTQQQSCINHMTSLMKITNIYSNFSITLQLLFAENIKLQLLLNVYSPINRYYKLHCNILQI